MKIEAIVFNDTAEMTVLHPVTGKALVGKAGKPMTVTLYGIQSKQYRSAKNTLMNDRTGNRHQKVTAEMVHDDGAGLLATCTKAFNHCDDVDFGCGNLTVDRAKEIYTETPWFRDQVDDFMADNARFLVKSKTH